MRRPYRRHVHAKRPEGSASKTCGISILQSISRPGQSLYRQHPGQQDSSHVDGPPSNAAVGGTAGREHETLICASPSIQPLDTLKLTVVDGDSARPPSQGLPSLTTSLCPAPPAPPAATAPGNTSGLVIMDIDARPRLPSLPPLLSPPSPESPAVENGVRLPARLGDGVAKDNETRARRLGTARGVTLSSSMDLPKIGFERKRKYEQRLVYRRRLPVCCYLHLPRNLFR